MRRMRGARSDAGHHDSPATLLALVLAIGVVVKFVH